MMPRSAMLLAAGFGTRMRPLTDRTAKPLLPLGGRALIDHALDRLAEVGVETVLVNTHWQADRVKAHLAGRSHPHIVVRHETSLLDTGGSVNAAIDHLGPGPFFVVNGDAFWLDGPRPALQRLADALDPTEAAGVLLVHRSFQVSAEVGSGDFSVDPLGIPSRPGEREIAPYVYAGLQIITPGLLSGAPNGPFSMNLAWDKAMAVGQLRAIVHDGLWFHLSAPADLAEAESILQGRPREEAR